MGITQSIGRSKCFDAHKAPRPRSDHDRCSINGRAIHGSLLWLCQGFPFLEAFTKASVACLFLFVWLILSYPSSLSLTVNPVEIVSDQFIEIDLQLFNPPFPWFSHVTPCFLHSTFFFQPVITYYSFIWECIMSIHSRLAQETFVEWMCECILLLTFPRLVESHPDPPCLLGHALLSKSRIYLFVLSSFHQYWPWSLGDGKSLSHPGADPLLHSSLAYGPFLLWEAHTFIYMQMINNRICNAQSEFDD